MTHHVVLIDFFYRKVSFITKVMWILMPPLLLSFPHISDKEALHTEASHPNLWFPAVQLTTMGSFPDCYSRHTSYHCWHFSTLITFRHLPPRPGHTLFSTIKASHMKGKSRAHCFSANLFTLHTHITHQHLNSFSSYLQSPLWPALPYTEYYGTSYSI